MTRTVFSRDVRPITDLRAHGAEIVTQVQRTKRPIVVTRRGRAAAIVVDVNEYERMQEELEFGRAVDGAAAQAKRGEFASDAAVARALGRLRG